MYKVTWDPEINGVLLDDKIGKHEEIAPPRPVFHEELDLLGLKQYWQYEASEFPLLWSIGRGYYHHGVLVAEAKGGNLYEAPELILHQKGLQLTPIEVEQALARNREALSVCANDAKDFVQATYKKYERKIDYFAVAFSGGKDSQVVLDIVSQMLAPDKYMVMFTDTTMEIPFTHDIVATTAEFYKTLYPGLKFYKASPPKDALELWEIFGSPSRLHRWCCSVCKTAPFAKRIKELHKEDGKEKMPKTLIFEGTRSNESTQRSKYQRIVVGLKHANQRNARVIFYWNTTEFSSKRIRTTLR